jgi:hypothetical protein
VTRLDTVLKPYYAEADGIASAHDDTQDNGSAGAVVLCVDISPDVLAYLRGLLKSAGHRVVTAENLHDGLILLKTMRPAVVVMGAGLNATARHVIGGGIPSTPAGERPGSAAGGVLVARCRRSGRSGAAPDSESIGKRRLNLRATFSGRRAAHVPA